MRHGASASGNRSISGNSFVGSGDHVDERSNRSPRNDDPNPIAHPDTNVAAANRDANIRSSLP